MTELTDQGQNGQILVTNLLLLERRFSTNPTTKSNEMKKKFQACQLIFRTLCKGLANISRRQKGP